MKKSALIALALISANSAAAQDAGWAYKATLYGWFPGMSTSMTTPFGTVDSDSSSSDALSNLDMAFMGTLAAQNDRWGFVGDLLYTDLSSSQNTPFALYGDANVDVKLTAFSGYALYRLSTDPKALFDLGVGFRNFNVDVDLSLSPGRLPGASQSVSKNWTDPLIAARLSVPIDENWFFVGFADWGGTSSDDQTWQVYAGVGYNFNDKWSGQLGYRFMNISNEIDGNDVSIDLSGPVFAVSYNF